MQLLCIEENRSWLGTPTNPFLPVQPAQEKGTLNSALLQSCKPTVIFPASGSVAVNTPIYCNRRSN